MFEDFTDVTLTEAAAVAFAEETLDDIATLETRYSGIEYGLNV